MQIPKRKPGKYAAGPADDNLTHAAMKKLEEDLARLERSRPAAVEELRRTREMGDLSENAAYTAAKGRLLGMDIRAQEIKERLKNAIPIKHGAGPGGTVRLGATVTLLVNGKERIYDIVGEQEANPASGAISYHSPLGQKLIGKRAGQVAVIDAGGKQITYEIVEVR